MKLKDSKYKDLFEPKKEPLKDYQCLLCSKRLDNYSHKELHNHLAENHPEYNDGSLCHFMNLLDRNAKLRFKICF